MTMRITVGALRRLIRLNEELDDGNVNIPARIVSQLTDEEYRALLDQMQARAEKMTASAARKPSGKRDDDFRITAGEIRKHMPLYAGDDNPKNKPWDDYKKKIVPRNVKDPDDDEEMYGKTAVSKTTPDKTIAEPSRIRVPVPR
jgi:hypothetical protein